MFGSGLFFLSFSLYLSCSRFRSLMAHHSVFVCCALFFFCLGNFFGFLLSWFSNIFVCSRCSLFCPGTSSLFSLYPFARLQTNGMRTSFSAWMIESEKQQMEQCVRQHSVPTEHKSTTQNNKKKIASSRFFGTHRN